ncbi:MAG: hypothetical protein R3Y04_02750 [Rikenellaceae bacterium]
MMKIKIYSVLLLVALLVVCGCNRADVDTLSQSYTSSVVEVLEDGTMQVSASLSSKSMSEVSVSTRADNLAEDNIYDGWCVIFGVDPDATGSFGYGPNSPLLYKSKILANTNGRFFMTFEEIETKCFMRINVNLSDREDQVYEDAITQSVADSDGSEVSLFRDFYHQSEGLNAIYDMSSYEVKRVATGSTDSEGYTTYTYTVDENESKPDPASLQSAFPMSSYGYVLDNGVNEDDLEAIFSEDIYMIRLFSKVVVFAGDNSGFTLNGVTLLDGANEAKLRSTVLDDDGNVVDNFEVPENLGGTIDFKEASALASPSSTSGKAYSESTPIYLYPNTGGNYVSNGVVNQSINPTYIIVRGQADGYDEEGYYKIALKGKYPLTYNDDGSVATESDLTYDILRDTYFKVTLDNVDKPGYKTFDDAADYNNPANNISYSITISGSDNRNEYLVSKGTYFVELEGSRIYAKGFLTDGVEASVKFTLNPTTGNQHPNVYVYAGDAYGSSADISVENCVQTIEGAATSTTHSPSGGWVTIPASTDISEVVVNVKATDSGRLRIRCGDILKYIPITYESAKASYMEEMLEIDGVTFEYSEIVYDEGSDEILSSDGLLAENPVTTVDGNEVREDRQFGATLYPINADGVTKLYVVQSEPVDPVINLSSSEYSSAADIVSAVVALIESGYTTISFEGVYSSSLLYSNGTSIFELISEQLSDGVTYSVDLSGVTVSNAGDSVNKDYNIDLFDGVDNISTLIIWGGSKLVLLKKDDTFSSMSDLTTVVVGSASVPVSSSSFKIEQGAFSGCSNLKTILIYTTTTDITIESSNIVSTTKTATYYNSTTKVYLYVYGTVPDNIDDYTDGFTKQ